MTSVVMADPANSPRTKYLYSVPEAMILLSLKRSTIYELLRSGRLRSVREGTSRRIPAGALTEYVALLEAEASAVRKAC